MGGGDFRPLEIIMQSLKSSRGYSTSKQARRRRKNRRKNSLDREESRVGVTIENFRTIRGARSPFEETRSPKSRGHRAVNSVGVFAYGAGVLVVGVSPRWIRSGDRSGLDRSDDAIEFGGEWITGHGWWFDITRYPELEGLSQRDAVELLGRAVVEFVNDYQWR